MARKRNYPMGSISTGTMRSEDLIPTFLTELGYMKPLKREHAKLIGEIEKRMESADYYESGDAETDLNEDLFDALGEYAADYFYFGSHPGDGADYGFWLSECWEEQLDDNGGIKVNGIEDIPADHVGDVAVISDHGNVTMYRRGRNHHLYEVWAVV